MSNKDKNNDIEEISKVPIESTDSTKEEFYEGFSPLDEPVKERAYTQGNLDGSKIVGEIEEPSFDAPNFSDFDENEDAEPSSFNPEIANLDKKEQAYATEQMVDTVLDVYVKAHQLANNFTKLKENKIQDAIDNGEISQNLRIPIDERGGTMGLMEYVGEYNNQLSDAIKVEDDFIEKVKPPMIRVFQKKGLALTDEQFLMVTFGGDIITKGALIYQLVKQNNKLIEMWKDQSVPQSRPQASKPKEQSAKQVPREEEVAKKPQYEEPEEEFSAEAMVREMMNGKEDSNFQNADLDESMPIFGDNEILKNLSKLSEEQTVIDIIPAKNTKGRGRPKKNK